MDKVVQIVPAGVIFAGCCLFSVLFVHYLDTHSLPNTLGGSALHMMPSGCELEDNRPGCG